jgi:hypothetical protein
MISAAHVIFNNQHGDQCLEWLFEELEKLLPQRCSRTEWRGFSTVVPQILVDTEPVALTIQVDDSPDYVPAETTELIEEVEGRIEPQMLLRLKQCDCRLDVMSATPNEPIVTEDAIVVVAGIDLDPQREEVAQVLAALSDLTSGFIEDCVNGRLRVPGQQEWLEVWKST